MECWDVEQARKFIAATGGYRLEAYYVLALDSGMRPSELLALQWPDVNWAGRTVFVQRALEERNGKFRVKPPKSRAGTRTIRLTARTMAVLAEHRKRMAEEGQDVDRGTIFVTRAGSFQSQATIYRRSFMPILKKAGLAKVRPYILRHTSATLLLGKDVSVMAVSRRLGHEKIRTTLEHYGHVLPSMQERAVEVMEEVFRADCPTSVPQDVQVA
jgi:integrase